MAPCSMPLISIPYTLSWRRWDHAPAVIEKAADAVTTLSAFVAAKSGGFVLGFLEALVTFLLTIFLLFFLFRDGEAFVAAFTDLLPRPASGNRSSAPSAPCSRPSSVDRSCVASSREQPAASGGVGWPLLPRVGGQYHDPVLLPAGRRHSVDMIDIASGCAKRTYKSNFWRNRCVNHHYFLISVAERLT